MSFIIRLEKWGIVFAEATYLEKQIFTLSVYKELKRILIQLHTNPSQNNVYRNFPALYIGLNTIPHIPEMLQSVCDHSPNFQGKHQRMKANKQNSSLTSTIFAFKDESLLYRLEKKLRSLNVPNSGFKKVMLTSFGNPLQSNLDIKLVINRKAFIHERNLSSELRPE